MARSLNLEDVERIERLHHGVEVMRDAMRENPFRQDLEKRIRDYPIHDRSIGREVSLSEYAQRHGLTDKLDAYIDDQFRGVQGYLSSFLDRVESVKLGARRLTGVANKKVIGKLGGGRFAKATGALAKMPLDLAIELLAAVPTHVLGYTAGAYRTPWGPLRSFADFNYSLGSGWMRSKGLDPLLDRLEDDRRWRTRLAESQGYQIAQRLHGEAREVRRPGALVEYRQPPIYAADMVPSAATGYRMAA